jgi:hypothetical protein
MSTDDPQSKRVASASVERARGTGGSPPRVDVVAGVLALVLPGLGHLVRGERARGVRILGGTLGLFFGGLLIGGIDVVDRREDRMWFVAQGAIGPLAFGVDAVHQRWFKAIDPVTRVRRSPGPHEVIGDDGVIGSAPAGGGPRSRKSVGKVNELGTLFCAVAGMLNVIVFVDALFPGRPKRRARDDAGGTMEGVLAIEVLIAGVGAAAEDLGAGPRGGPA